jgi:hypothetical protein
MDEGVYVLNRILAEGKRRQRIWRVWCRHTINGNGRSLRLAVPQSRVSAHAHVNLLAVGDGRRHSDGRKGVRAVRVGRRRAAPELRRWQALRISVPAN